MIDAHRVTLSAEDDFDGWRDAARGLAEAGVPPSAIAWQVEGKTGDLFGGPDTSPPPPGPSFAVPRSFVDLARKAICHSATRGSMIITGSPRPTPSPRSTFANRQTSRCNC